jgi:hypothetical protein
MSGIVSCNVCMCYEHRNLASGLHTLGGNLRFVAGMMLLAVVEGRDQQ